MCMICIDHVFGRKSPKLFCPNSNLEIHLERVKWKNNPPWFKHLVSLSCVVDTLECATIFAIHFSVGGAYPCCVKRLTLTSESNPPRHDSCYARILHASLCHLEIYFVFILGILIAYSQESCQSQLLRLWAKLDTN